MHHVGLSKYKHWHLFWPFDGLRVEKPPTFPELYTALNGLMGEQPNLLTPVNVEKKCEYGEFELESGRVCRTFGCGNLLVSAARFPDEWFDNMAGDVLQAL